MAWYADPDWDWNTAGEESPDQLYERWRDAVARSRALFAEALADGGPGRQGTIASNPEVELPNLRYILLNMIEEYARHNGHDDLIRESVDGLVGQDPQIKPRRPEAPACSRSADRCSSVAARGRRTASQTARG